MKKQKNISKEKAIQKVRNLKNNRKRGNSYEVKIAKELRELGFPGVKTSRSESKSMDDKKVDLVDTEGKLFFYPQLKKLGRMPNYFTIEKECPLKDKPFVVFWDYQVPTAQTFRSAGEVVIIPKSFFYELIKHYNDKRTL